MKLFALLPIFIVPVLLSLLGQEKLPRMNHPKVYVKDQFLDAQGKRGACAARLTTLSEYVGFEGKFEADGTTLVMTGSELCDTGWLDTLPKIGRDDAIAVGFTKARCIGVRGEVIEENIVVE